MSRCRSHQAGTAVFSTLPVPTVEEALADLESDFDDPAYATFVAVHDGRSRSAPPSAARSSFRPVTRR